MRRFGIACVTTSCICGTIGSASPYRTPRYSKELEVEATNNAKERAIGWVMKERCCTMRSHKRKRPILNVTSLTARLPDQPAGYHTNPLFAS